jgi:hypothetical protein
MIGRVDTPGVGGPVCASVVLSSVKTEHR